LDQKKGLLKLQTPETTTCFFFSLCSSLNIVLSKFFLFGYGSKFGPAALSAAL